MAKKTYNQKLNESKDMPCVSEVAPESSWAKSYGGTRMCLPSPLCYDGVMKRVPQEKLLTTEQIRAYFAKKHNADFTCPLLTGIFANLAAHASVERKGVDETPYWRTLKKAGELNEKYPEGIDGQKIRLEMEGHTVVQRGKRYFVMDFADKLFDLEGME
jgi:hypothetical protein